MPDSDNPELLLVDLDKASARVVPLDSISEGDTTDSVDVAHSADQDALDTAAEQQDIHPAVTYLGFKTKKRALEALAAMHTPVTEADIDTGLRYQSPSVDKFNATSGESDAQVLEFRRKPKSRDGHIL